MIDRIQLEDTFHTLHKEPQNQNNGYELWVWSQDLFR